MESHNHGVLRRAALQRGERGVGMGSRTFSLGHRFIATLCTGLTLAAGTTIAADQQPTPPRDCNPATDDPLHGGLPFFDARQDANEFTIPSVKQAIQNARA